MAWPTVTVDTTHMDASTDDASQARADIKQMADNVNAIKDSRSAASGIASLDSSAKVPTGELPTIPATQGGTGQTSYSVGDILYASAAGTLTKLGVGANGYVLTSNGPGVAPSWQQSGGGLVSGTRLAFQQTSAPTGWTKDTTAALNDSIMRIVTGTAANGGSTAFSTFNAQTTTSAHTLTLAQIPSHTHTYSYISATAGSDVLPPSSPTGRDIATTNTGSAGSGGSHSHGLTHNIKYYDFIIASRD